MENSLSADEYKNRHAQEMKLLMHAIDRSLEAKDRMREVFIPGLGGTEHLRNEDLDSEA